MSENFEDQVILGQEAEKVKSNRAYVIAMTAMKGEALTKIQSVSMIESDRIQRDELIRKLQVINEFESELENMMENGQFAQKVIDSNNK